MKGENKRHKEKLDILYDKIEELQKTRMEYLEIDKNAAARRIEKQIEKVELEIKLLGFNKLKQERDIYKKIVKDYPALQNEINGKLIENGIIKRY